MGAWGAGRAHRTSSGLPRRSLSPPGQVLRPQGRRLPVRAHGEAAVRARGRAGRVRQRAGGGAPGQRRRGLDPGELGGGGGSGRRGGAWAREAGLTETPPTAGVARLGHTWRRGVGEGPRRRNPEWGGLGVAQVRRGGVAGGGIRALTRRSYLRPPDLPHLHRLWARCPLCPLRAWGSGLRLLEGLVRGPSDQQQRVGGALSDSSSTLSRLGGAEAWGR